VELHVTHRFALFLEKEVGGQEWWPEFVSRTSQCRLECQQTQWGYLQPPAPRTKSRWLNVRPLVGWAFKVRAYGRRQHLNGQEEFAARFGWLQAYAERLREALQMVRLLEKAAQQIKHHGLDDQQVRQCARHLGGLRVSERVHALGRKVIAFLKEQVRAIRSGETLLSSSDVIESLFGKYKAVLERSPLCAITTMVLLVAALTSDRREATIRQAMEEVRAVEVKAWFASHGQPSLLAKRRAALGQTKGTNLA
jgi:hypothetical protein